MSHKVLPPLQKHKKPNVTTAEGVIPAQEEKLLTWAIGERIGGREKMILPASMNDKASIFTLVSIFWSTLESSEAFALGEDERWRKLWWFRCGHWRTCNICMTKIPLLFLWRFFMKNVFHIWFLVFSGMFATILWNCVSKGLKFCAFF